MLPEPASLVRFSSKFSGDWTVVDSELPRFGDIEFNLWAGEETGAIRNGADQPSQMPRSAAMHPGRRKACGFICSSQSARPVVDAADYNAVADAGLP